MLRYLDALTTRASANFAKGHKRIHRSTLYEDLASGHACLYGHFQDHIGCRSGKYVIDFSGDIETFV